jgi:CDGSH-type Zn-finger protein
MNTASSLTKPQQKVVDTLGSLPLTHQTRQDLVQRGCDPRSINNLVKQGFLTTDGPSFVRLARHDFTEADVDALVKSTIPPAPPVPASNGLVIYPEGSGCLCGCGASARKAFVQGHDAKLHSLVNKFRKENPGKQMTSLNQAQRAWLATKPWALAVL